MDEILDHYCVTEETLDIQLHHNKVYLLANYCSAQDYRLIGPSLNLTDVEIEDIFGTSENPIVKKTNVLNTWIKKKGHKATYLEFIKVLVKHELVSPAGEIIQKLKQEGLIEKKGTEQAS